MKHGGILYTDHDLDAAFVNKYRLGVRLFRRLWNMEKRYMQSGRGIDENLYKKSEWWSEGLDLQKLLSSLKLVGFREVDVYHHWLGVNRLTTILFRKRAYPAWLAPLFSIVAEK